MMQIETFELKNKFKDKIEILNYGARIYKWSINTKENFREIILRYPQPNDYINDPFYLGAIVGPYANRIAHSRVYLNKKNIFYNQMKEKIIFMVEIIASLRCFGAVLSIMRIL